MSDEVIATTLPGADPSCSAAAFASAGLVIKSATPALRTTLLRAADGNLASSAATLQASPLIERVQKNYRYAAQLTPNDPLYRDQAHWVAAAFPEAWSRTVGQSDIVIAVLDSGVDADHPDLIDRVAPGWNSLARSSDTSDPTGHGTAVAGLLGAATDNAHGVAAGVWTGNVLVVRVADDDGAATADSIAAGIAWAVDHAARIINISFAPLQGDATIARAVQYAESAGAVVFISAGNDGKTVTTPDDALAVFVGARKEDGLLADFSSRGPFVDLAAPGVAIWTTARGGSYSAVSGTSFAAPIAAAAAALVRALRPDFSPAAVREVLFQTADDLGPLGRDVGFGAGGLNAGAALAAAAARAATRDATPPRVSVAAPTDGAEVSGIVTLDVDASDDASGVAGVLLKIDGAAIAGDDSAPYRFALDLRSLTAGPHVLQVSASDTTGNTAAAAPVNVVVTHSTAGPSDCIGTLADARPPTVRIEQPADGAEVSRSIGIEALAVDDAALAGASLLVDGQAVASASLRGLRATASFVWDASGAPAGRHVVTVRVADAAAGTAEASITLRKP